MGRGIAQLCAQAGIVTLMFDARAGAVVEAIAAIDKGLGGLVSKGRISAESKNDAMARLKPVDAIGEVKGAGIAVEAIVEKLEPKRELFRSLETVLAPDAILATNTSSLSITAVAAGCERPE